MTKNPAIARQATDRQRDDLAPVIAIDGPSGSGKGTVARLLAEKYRFHLLDSGALYRTAVIAAERHGIRLDDETAVANAAHAMRVSFSPTGREGVAVLLDGTDITAQVRAEQTGMKASQVAPMPALRAALLAVQRRFRQPPGLVADGRDMGTVIFPQAMLKIFLTASATERARRRYKQLKETGCSDTIEKIFCEINARDKRDEQRTSAPLRAADDAFILDSTSLSPDDVVGQISRYINIRLPA